MAATTLESKTAIVTGASRGIGNAIALELARNGANLVICARTERLVAGSIGALDETVKEIAALGTKAVAVRADLAVDEEIRAVVARAQDAFGRIDILVNNAAYRTRGGFLETSVDEYDLAHRVNVHAAYLAAQLVIPAMLDVGGGVVFNITSGAAQYQGIEGPSYGHPSYPITKAALDRFTGAIAQEFYGRNIAVISVAPGRTITERGRLNLAPGATVDGNLPEDTAQFIAEMAQDPMKFTGRIMETTAWLADRGIRRL